MPFGNGVNWSGKSTVQSAKAARRLEFVVTWSSGPPDSVSLNIGSDIPGADVAKSLVTAWNNGSTSSGTVAVGFYDWYVRGGTVMLFDRGNRTITRVEIELRTGSTIEVPPPGAGPAGRFGYGDPVDAHGLSLCRVRPHILHPPS